MDTATDTDPPRNLKDFPVALIAAPWALFNRPSVQIGALKAYLQEQSDCPVSTFHFYLEIAHLLGPDLYHQLALSGWGGEALFASLLYPEKGDSAAKLLKSVNPEQKFASQQISNCIREIGILSEKWVTSQDFGSFGLIGFSVCFNQLFASLYLARLLKKHNPSVPIVFGGSSCSGDTGRSLQNTFNEIDFVIDGEGENKLLELCLLLASEGKNDSTAKTELSFSSLPAGQSCKAGRLSLNSLPYPDFSDYFQQVGELFGANHFIPILPVEFSRGCLWNKCTFCNLNLQWQDYRYKSASRMVEEIDHLSSKHESLHFAFTDNALPPAEADLFFETCTGHIPDFDFFGEIRAITSLDRLTSYRRGGLRTVQVGIEALSISLLKKMNKGTTTIENIAAMKNCMVAGILLEGNLIVEFPGTSETEIEETLKNLETVLPYYPLQPATFFLGYGSPIFLNHQDYGISAISSHRKYRQMMPDETLEKLQLMVCDFRCDKTRQKKLWNPVREKIRRWQHFHASRTNSHRPPLSYRDGGEFLIIEQELPDSPVLRHRLRSTSRRIYLFCETPQKITDILQEFGNIKEQALQQFIAMMCTKKLMFAEAGRVLSLAIRNR